MSGPSPEYRAFVEGAIGILQSVIMADGKFSQEEFAGWVKVQHQHPLFADVPAEAFNDMLRRVKAQLLSQTPWRDLVTGWSAAIPQQYRMSLFQLACEFATVDKELEGKEPEVIRHMWHALGIPDDQARQIFMSRIEKMGG